MKKSSENNLKDINRSLKRINESIETPRKIDLETPLLVELHEKEKVDKWKLLLKPLLISIIVLLAIMLVISALIVIPEEFDIIKSDSNAIQCAINYPSYLSQGEEIVINLTINNRSNNLISDVKFFLIYQPELPIMITSDEGSSLTELGILEANEIKTKKIKFYLNRPIDKSQIKFKLKITSNETKEVEKEYKIKFFPIPYTKTFSFWLFVSLIGVIVVIIISTGAEKSKEMRLDSSMNNIEKQIK
jgi:hypothetical protein